MKKILLIQVLFTFIFFSCSKDDFEEPNPTDKKLESFTAYMVPFRYGQPSESSKFIWEAEEYDNQGNLKTRKYRSNYDFDTEDNWLNTDDYVYENNILKEKIEDKLFWTRRYVYSYSNNLLSKTDVYDEDGLVEKYEYKYQNGDEKPKQMLYWWMFFDNEPTTHTYTYDGHGNMIKDSIDYSTIPYGILMWKYDSHNNMIEESYYSADDDKTIIQDIRSYNYDSNGKIQEYIFSSWYTLYFQKYIYQYSDDGKISEINVYESTNGQDGIFEQKGIIKYEYNYY